MLREVFIGMVLSLPNFPVDGVLTSKFGKRVSSGKVAQHHGIDIGTKSGSPVYAPADGVIEHVGPMGGYGRLVIIRHQETLTTRYGHLSAIFAYEGEKIKKGEIIGLVGETGRATGPHLHYEIRRNGKAVDPLNFYFYKTQLLAVRR